MANNVIKNQKQIEKISKVKKEEMKEEEIFKNKMNHIPLLMFLLKLYTKLERIDKLIKYKNNFRVKTDYDSNFLMNKTKTIIATLTDVNLEAIKMIVETILSKLDNKIKCLFYYDESNYSKLF